MRLKFTSVFVIGLCRQRPRKGHANRNNDEIPEDSMSLKAMHRRMIIWQSKVIRRNRKLKDGYPFKVVRF